MTNNNYSLKYSLMKNYTWQAENNEEGMKRNNEEGEIMSSLNLLMLCTQHVGNLTIGLKVVKLAN